MGAWQFANKNCKVNKNKIADLMVEMQIPEGYQSFVARLVSLARQAVLGPMSAQSQWMDLVDRHDLETELVPTNPEDELNADEGIALARSVLKRSNEIARYQIDFDDMIYCPVFFKIRVLQHDWVLVDEAQDTNPARRLLAGMMTKSTGRQLWVGDRHQAIFGFTGADADSVDRIIKTYRCASLPLTVTYRCPQTVVTAAQQYVSHIQAHESAPMGEVVDMARTAFDHTCHEFLGKDDAVLCRNTAPLVTLAYKLLKKGVACHVEGKDIGRGLIALITKWKKVRSADAYLKRLESGERASIERMLAKKNDAGADSIRDRCDTIRVLAEGCGTVAEMVAKVEKLFGDHDDDKDAAKVDNLTLSTVHKSKGREWGNVYVLDFAKLMPSPMAKQDWQKEQENNLIYVAFTRAQSKLIRVG
jgi:superfamily I DNA/RNA helicase